MDIQLDPRAHALRPVRAISGSNCFRFYEATTFPPNPFAGCHIWLRRCQAVGFLTEDAGNIVIDVLDANGDIVQDFPLTRPGLKYLRTKLKFKVDMGE